MGALSQVLEMAPGAVRGGVPEVAQVAALILVVVSAHVLVLASALASVPAAVLEVVLEVVLAMNPAAVDVEALVAVLVTRPSVRWLAHAVATIAWAALYLESQVRAHAEEAAVARHEAEEAEAYHHWGVVQRWDLGH